MTSSGVGECRLGALLVWCGIFTTLAGAAHSAKDDQLNVGAEDYNPVFDGGWKFGIRCRLHGLNSSPKFPKLPEFQHILRLPPGRLGSNNTFPIPVVSPLTPGSPCVPLSPYY
ncbi:hypothetical protein M8J76_009775 [Diaphorina citri]|nr:hypothetical protein M8J76_009775 [Diaphorina citri]